MATLNPGASLSELFELYSSDDAQQNPPLQFESWLLTQDIDPSSFPESDWHDLLSEQGLDDDEIAGRLEGDAEWSPAIP